MYLSQSAIALLYLWSFLAGVLLGAVYDCLRLTRLLPGGGTPTRLREKKLPLLGKLPPPRRVRAMGVLVFAEDFLFCIFAGVVLTLLFYEAFDGKIRVPALFLATAGFFAAHASLGRLSKRVAGVIGFFLEVAVRYLAYVLAFPVKRAVIAAGRANEKREKRARLRYTEKKFRELEKEGTDANGKNKKKTVQSEPDGADLSGDSRGGVDRRVHQQHHAV